jgi:predicted SnoaL-like aldol condensation-catalyzing enzyme
MRATVRRVAGRVAETIREMNDAQRRMLVNRTATDRYIQHPNAAPDTFGEFMARTSGTLLHEPPARQRMKKAPQS